MKKIFKGAFSLLAASVFLSATGHAQWVTGVGVVYTNAATPRAGVGTNNPQDRLHVESIGNNWPFAAIRISNRQVTGGDTCNATAQIAVAHAAGSFSNVATIGDMVIRVSDSNADPLTGECAEDIVLSAQTNGGRIRFATTPTYPGGDVERATILPNGNFGVGTNAPDSRLQIDGDTRLGVIRNQNNGLPGYGNYLRFSGGPDDNFWDSENTDALWMARHNVASNVTELRLAIGDDTVNSSNFDSFVVGVEFGGWVPRFRFRSDGTAYKPGGGSWTVLSDSRIKENVQPFTDGLTLVRSINPVWFNYKEEYVPGGQRYVGVLAQDMQKIAPYTVSKDKLSVPGSKEQMDVLTYDPNAVTYITLNAIKELDAKVDELNALKGEVSALKAENEQIKQRLAALEAHSGVSASSVAVQYEDVLLEQNNPNPFGESTNIMYFVPANVAGNVEVVVADAGGTKVLQRYPASVNSPQQVTISAKGLDTGVYVYGISVNGQIVKSKKMMVLK